MTDEPPWPGPLSELIRRAAGGDRAAQAELLLPWAERLPRLVKKRMSDRLRRRYEPEDIAAEVLVKVIQGLEGFEASADVEKKFRAWVFGIARRTVVDAARAMNARKRGLGLLREELQAEATDPASTLSTALSRKDSLRQIARAVAELSERDRVLVEWFYCRGEKAQDTACPLAMSAGAVRQALRRAREQIKESIDRESLHHFRRRRRKSKTKGDVGEAGAAEPAGET